MQLTGTLTIPITEPSIDGFYQDVSLKLFEVTDSAEHFTQSYPISTDNTYSITFTPVYAGQPKLKLFRTSTNQVLGDTSVRGVQPRTFKVEPGDSSFFDLSFRNSAFGFDSALALIATAGAGNSWKSLSKEIVNGIHQAYVLSGIALPFKMNHMVPVSVGSPVYRTSTVALAAYSLGYYLEKYPSGDNKIQVCETLYGLLDWLLKQRSQVHGGLLTNGTGQSDYAETVGNILAFYAIRMAERVLNSSYNSIGTDLGNAIQTKLYYDNANGKGFYQGIYSTGVNNGSNLETELYGILFQNYQANFTLANYLMTQVELKYSLVDPVLNVSGFKATQTDSKLWVEGSYLASLVYHRLGNTAKFGQLRKDLNTLKQEEDGSFKYGVIKDGGYQILNYKSVGATAWSYIQNKMPDEVFDFRSNSILPGIPQWFLSAEQTVYKTKNDCGSGFTGQLLAYKVLKGMFITQDSQEAADLAAGEYAIAQAQTWVNANGTCTPVGALVDSQEVSAYFTKVCGAGFQGSTHLFTLPAGYVQGANQTEANDMAYGILYQAGPNNAETVGTCTPITVDVLVSPSYTTDSDNDVYVYFTAAQSLNVPVTIAYQYSLNGGTTWTDGEFVMAAGLTTSYSSQLLTLAGGQTFSIRITDLTPDTSGNQRYIYSGQTPTAFGNQERTGKFQRTNCPTGTGGFYTFTVPANTYSSTSVPAANALADAYMASQGPIDANLYGSCSSVFYNTRQQGFFQKDDCVTGEGSIVKYVVPENTYSSTVSPQAVLDLALADLAANGPQYARDNGICQITANNITISLTPQFSTVGSNLYVYMKASSSEAVTTNIEVSFSYVYGGGETYLAFPLNINSGTINSASQFLGVFADTGAGSSAFHASIISVSPTSHGGKNYIF